MNAGAPCIRVVADDRETGAGVIEALNNLPEVELSVARLALGDYEIDGKLLFERKTLTDLVLSIEDGRLFRQAIRLGGSGKRCAIILEGSSADLAHSQIRREAIQGALISVSFILGIPLLRSLNPEETARLMLYAARQARATVNGGVRRSGLRPRGKEKVQLRLLEGLPGIGPERARRLLAEFGSVEAVIAASATELQRVAGIGVRTVAAMRWAVEETSGSYSRAAEEDPPFPDGTV